MINDFKPSFNFELIKSQIVTKIGPFCLGTYAGCASTLVCPSMTNGGRPQPSGTFTSPV